MATKTIDELPPSATALDGTEEVPIWKDGATEKCTTQDIADLVPAPAGSPLLFIDKIVSAGFYRYKTDSLGDYNDGSTSLGGATAGVGTAATLLDRLSHREGSVGGGTGANFAFKQLFNPGIFRRPSGTAYAGSHKCTMRGGFPTAGQHADSRLFVGLVNSVGGVVVDIGNGANTLNNLINMVGIVKDDADANLFFAQNDASGTIDKVDTGITYASIINHLLRISIELLWGSDAIIVTIEDLDNGAAATHTFTTGLMSGNIELAAQFGANRGQTTGTGIVYVSCLDIVNMSDL